MNTDCKKYALLPWAVVDEAGWGNIDEANTILLATTKKQPSADVYIFMIYGESGQDDYNAAKNALDEIAKGFGITIVPSTVKWVMKEYEKELVREVNAQASNVTNSPFAGLKSLLASRQ